jgi:lysophospholipase L1-like esterase
MGDFAYTFQNDFGMWKSASPKRCEVARLELEKGGLPDPQVPQGTARENDGASPASRKRFPYLSWLVAALIWLSVFGGGVVLLVHQGILPWGVAMRTPGLDWDLIHQSDPGLVWTLKPNMKGVRFCGDASTPFARAVVDCTVSTNELGFRSPPLQQTKSGGGIRILALGDSTTFGLGVEQEESWPGRLQEILDPGRTAIEVINAGICGYSSVQGLVFLRDKCLALSPDVVIVTFSWNDSQYWGGVSDLERVHLAEHMDPGFAKGHRKRVTPNEYEWALSAMNELCTSHGARMLCLAWPGNRDFRTRPVRGVVSLVEKVDMQVQGSYYSFVKEMCARREMPFVDVLSLVGHDDSIRIDAVHFNPRGCDLVARGVARALEDHQMIPAGTVSAAKQ